MASSTPDPLKSGAGQSELTGASTAWESGGSSGEPQMHNHLGLLPLILVVVTISVNITIRKR